MSEKLPKGVATVAQLAEFDTLIRRTGWRTVPQIFVGEKMIGGFRELERLEANGELDRILSGS